MVNTDSLTERGQQAPERLPTAACCG
jgi:hypothetical protein